MTERLRVVLASASPRRRELLRSLDFDVQVRPSAYEEPDRPELAPRELAIVHARNKCLDVRPSHREAIVVAADTVVDVDGTAYNKPRDAADAERMLRDLSGRTHRVHTAVAFALDGSDEVHELCETTGVTFFPLDEREIAAYVAGGEPMDKAGGYGIQGFGATLVERIDGDFYTVMGFPLGRFVRSLRRLGIWPKVTKHPI